MPLCCLVCLFGVNYVEDEVLLAVEYQLRTARSGRSRCQRAFPSWKFLLVPNSPRDANGAQTRLEGDLAKSLRRATSGSTHLARTIRGAPHGWQELDARWTTQRSEHAVRGRL
jgi:hypothetical protein